MGLGSGMHRVTDVSTSSAQNVTCSLTRRADEARRVDKIGGSGTTGGRGQKSTRVPGQGPKNLRRRIP